MFKAARPPTDAWRAARDPARLTPWIPDAYGQRASLSRIMQGSLAAGRHAGRGGCRAALRVPLRG